MERRKEERGRREEGEEEEKGREEMGNGDGEVNAYEVTGVTYTLEVTI